MDAIDRQHLVYEAHADICKTFASPWRLRIVEALGDGECTVSQLVATLGIPKSNVSMHLAVMRQQGVVRYRREGGYLLYRLASPKILQACRLMRDVLLERFQAAAELSRLGLEASPSGLPAGAQRSAGKR